MTDPEGALHWQPDLQCVHLCALEDDNEVVDAVFQPKNLAIKLLSAAGTG